MMTSHAALPPEEYWKSVLPNTPMPKAVSDLLHQGYIFLTEIIFCHCSSSSTS